MWPNMVPAISGSWLVVSPVAAIETCLCVIERTRDPCTFRSTISETVELGVQYELDPGYSSEEVV
jgi:hypothetical protein